MSQKSSEMKAQGIDVINMSVGEPDFNTPENIKEAAKKAIDENYSKYSPVPGYADLRKAIVAKLKRENGLDYSVSEVLVSNGAKQSVCNTVMALINDGDEVIIPAPYWVSYPQMVKLAGGNPVIVNAGFDQNFKMTPQQLEAAITPKTKLLIICSPSNPTGSVYTQEELDALAAVIKKHEELYVLADEIYEHINYVGKHASIAKVAGMKERSIIVNGVSKAYAMTGWRIGYLAASPEIVRVAGKLFQHTISCTSGFIQKAAAMAFECGEEIEAMRRTYQERRDFFVGGLNAVPGVHCELPEGAFYAWTKFDLPGMDSNQGGEYILNNAKVVGVPGVSYGEEKGCWMRFSFATDDAQLRRAVENIARMMKGLKK